MRHNFTKHSRKAFLTNIDMARVGQQDIIGVASPWRNGDFMRRFVARLMGADSKKYHNIQQLYGGLIAFKNNETSRQFLQDWLNIHHVPGAISFEPGDDEHSFFTAARSQAIFTVLYHQYGFKPYPLELIDVTDLRAQGGATVYMDMPEV
jgi:hypothetical protein